MLTRLYNALFPRRKAPYSHFDGRDGANLGKSCQGLADAANEKRIAQLWEGLEMDWLKRDQLPQASTIVPFTRPVTIAKLETAFNSTNNQKEI